MTLSHLLLFAGCCMFGTAIGVIVAKLWRRKHPFDVKHVRPRCLERGHRWRRIPDVPIQFCSRYGCMGARVAPFMFEHFPEDLTKTLESKLDETAALSMDRQP